MSEPLAEPVEPVVDPAAEPAEPAEPAWSGPSQEEWTTVQQSLGYIAQALFPQQEGQQTVDPFADDFQQRLDGYIEQKLAPLSAFQQEVAMSEAEEQAMDLLGKFAEADPFLLPDSMGKARTLANDFLPQTQAQYGFGPKAATEALKLAHQAVRQWEDQVGQAFHDRQMQQLQGLGSVRREPAPAGQNGAASQLIQASGPGDETALLRKYFGG